MLIFRFLIAAAIIFAGFRILNLIFNKLTIIPIRKRSLLVYVIPLFEMVVWIVALLWIAISIYETKNYPSLLFIIIVFALLSAPLFFATRNMIAGIIFRLQNRITEGMYIDIDGIRGVIRRAGHLGLEIEDRHMNLHSLSYHRIRSKIIVRQGGNPFLEKARIRFEFAKTEGIDELCQQLKKEVLNTPWVAASYPPVIENTHTENGKLIIDIGVFMLDRSYTDNVRAGVMTAFNN